MTEPKCPLTDEEIATLLGCDSWSVDETDRGLATAAYRKALEWAAEAAEDYDGEGHAHGQYTQLGDSVKTQADIANTIRAKLKELKEKED